MLPAGEFSETGRQQLDAFSKSAALYIETSGPIHVGLSNRCDHEAIAACVQTRKRKRSDAFRYVTLQEPRRLLKIGFETVTTGDVEIEMRGGR